MLYIYGKCKSFSNSAKFLGISRYTWSKKWYSLGLSSPKITRPKAKNLELPCYKFAVVSDLHWGSVGQQKTAFDHFINECRKRDINFLINLGDSVDGIIYRRGHKNTRFLNSRDEFEEYFLKHYPNNFKKSIIINGNHEKTFLKDDLSYNFAKKMSIIRNDLTYAESGDIINGPGNIKLCIQHGGGSCATSTEPRTDRMKNIMINMMSKGKCADIYLMGHCHITSVIASFMGKMAIGAGCFALPTWEKNSKFYKNVDVCGAIIEYNVKDNKPVNTKVSFRYAEDYIGRLENDF